MNKQAWRILLLEDSPDDRIHIKSSLLKGAFRRYEFIEARTGEEALRFLNESSAAPFDCLIIDYNLPDMDALELLASLPRFEDTVSVPVVVLTGSTDPEVSRSVIRAGAQDFVGKDWLTSASLTRAVENARERYEMACDLLESGLKVRVIYDSALQFIGLLDVRGRLLEANGTALRFIGQSLDQIKGCLFSETPWWAGSPQAKADCEAAVARAASGEIVRLETKHYGMNDLSIIVDFSLKPLLDQQGKVSKLIFESWDVTERVQAKIELRRREEEFRMLADNISQFAWIADETGWIFWYNKRWFDYTGTTAEEMEGWGWRTVHHPDHLDRVVRKFKGCIESGEVWEDTFPLRCHDGEYRWFLSRALPIHDKQGKITRWFGTNTDVTEQRKIEETLRENDRLKNEFLAMLAHELRNPLAPIRNAAQLMRLARITDPMMVKARDMIDRQVGHLVRLVDDLLDISRFSRGKITLKKEVTDLASVIVNAVEASRPLIDSRHHELLVSVCPQPLKVDGDFTRLVQVVLNLLNNIAKYTPPHGQIELTLESRDANAELRIRDNGIGISPEALPKIFDMFVQVDRGDHAESGLGIGLTLVRKLLELHGGTVEAKSEGAGHGSEFIVLLPLTE